MADQQGYTDVPLMPAQAQAAGYQDVPVAWPERYPKTAAATRGALATLPAMGGAVGGMLAGPETGGLALVPGIALGAGVGQGLRDLIAHGIGLESTTPARKAGNIAVTTATTGALAAVIPGLIEAAKTPATTLKEAIRFAVKPLTQSPGKTATDLVDAVLDELPKALHDQPAATLVRPAWQQWARDAEAAGQAALPSPSELSPLDLTRAMKAAQQAGPTPSNISPQMLRNQLGIAARRLQMTLTPEIEAAAGPLVQQGATPAAALQQAVAASKPMLTAGEAKLVDAMMRRGASDAEVQAALKAARAFNEKFGLTSPSRSDMLFPKGMRGKASGSGGLIP